MCHAWGWGSGLAWGSGAAGARRGGLAHGYRWQEKALGLGPPFWGGLAMTGPLELPSLKTSPRGLGVGAHAGGLGSCCWALSTLPSLTQ